MKELTKEQIIKFKKLAEQQTSYEYCSQEEWNPRELSGGNFDDAYYLGQKDAYIDNARLILDLFEIDYRVV